MTSLGRKYLKRMRGKLNRIPECYKPIKLCSECDKTDKCKENQAKREKIMERIDGLEKYLKEDLNING